MITKLAASVAIREGAESRLKIGLISGCDFKETRDDSKRLQVMRPHSFCRNELCRPIVTPPFIEMTGILSGL